MLTLLLVASLLIQPAQDVRQLVLTSEDGASIPVRHYTPPFSGAPIVVIVHDLGGSLQRWTDIAARLRDLGFSVVLFTLRGHGGAGKAWYYFTDAEIAGMQADLQAVVTYAHGSSGKLFLLGSGLGANLALKCTAENESIGKVVAISPGLRYRGIDIGEDVLNIPGEKMLFVASLEDVYSVYSIKELLKTFPAAPLTQYYSNAGHGVWLLKRLPEALDAVARWLSPE